MSVLVFVRLAVWSVVGDYRRVVREIPFTTIDLARCVGDQPYPDFSARPGYMHSFAMTENYIILPAASYLADPCAFGTHTNVLTKVYKPPYKKIPHGSMCPQHIYHSSWYHYNPLCSIIPHGCLCL